MNKILATIATMQLTNAEKLITMGPMKQLSKFNQNQENRAKKIFFHPSVVQNFPKTGFTYTDKFKFNKMLPDNDLNNHSEYHQFHPRHTVHGTFSYDLDYEEYYSQFFSGPLYDFDVRKSSLSEVAKFEMYGLFSREFIPKGSCIGIYNGVYLVGGKVDYHDYSAFTNFCPAPEFGHF